MLRAALKAAVIASSALFLMIILLPIAAVFLSVSPSELLARLTTPTVLDSLRLSLLASTVSTAIVLVLATPLSYVLARYRFKGRWLLDAVVDLPMVLPPAVAGLALLLAFAPRSLIGAALRSYGIILPGSFWAVVLAQVFVGSPFFIRSSKAAFAEVFKELEVDFRQLDGTQVRLQQAPLVVVVAALPVGDLRHFVLIRQELLGDLPERLRLSAQAAAHPRRVDETIVLDEFLGRVERELIRRALARSKGNKARAARLLGVTRPRLYRRMVQLGLE